MEEERKQETINKLSAEIQEVSSVMEQIGCSAEDITNISKRSAKYNL